MKVTAVSVAALALAPAALADPPKCAGKNFRSTTIVALGGTSTSTVNTTVRPTSKTTVAQTITQNKTVAKRGTTTIVKNVPSFKTTQTLITQTTTFTDTDNAETITPDPVTSTIPTDAGFIPAASALATGVSKRQKKGAQFAGPLCAVTVNKVRTITATNTITKGAPIIQTVNGGKVTVTSTKFLGGLQTVLQTSVITKFTTVTKTTTKTSTIIPTETADAEVVKVYDACSDLNLLGYTLSNGASSDSSDSGDSTTTSPAPSTSGSSTGGDDGDDSTPDSKRKREIVQLFRRAATKVGINSAKPGASYTIKPVEAEEASDCCAACQDAASCAGSYFTSDGTCNLVVASDCSGGQGMTAGSFYYDSDDSLDVGEGVTVSNGKCGVWKFGGAGTSDDASGDDEDSASAGDDDEDGEDSADEEEASDEGEDDDITSDDGTDGTEDTSEDDDNTQSKRKGKKPSGKS